MNRLATIIIGTLVLWQTLSAPAFSQAKYRIAAQVVGGLYAVNSEDALPFLQDRKFIGGYGIDASIIRQTEKGCGLYLDVEYFRSNASGPLVFNVTPGLGPNTVNTFHGKVSLDQFSVDIGPRYQLTRWLQAGFGPSFAMESRSVDVPYAGIADRLDSYCLGLNAVAAATLPFHETGNRGFFWYYTLKLRYLHSIFFDARGRNLSNYSQSFLTASLGAGIGYAF